MYTNNDIVQYLDGMPEPINFPFAADSPYAKKSTDVEKMSKPADVEGTSNDKRYRTAFLRIWAVNHLKKDNKELGKKAGEVVEYTLDGILSTINDWLKTRDFKFFVVEHKTEKGKIHFHVVLVFPNNSTAAFKTIWNRFPYSHIESCKKVRSCVRYLVHADYPDKPQYPWESIITNDPEKLEEYKNSEKANSDAEVDHIFDEIVAGNIKEYETEKIPHLIYIKRRAQIKNAFERRQQELMGKTTSRNIKVFVLQGAPRVGKSTFCKVWAKDNNKSICFSSESRDPWQDYAGQDVFVFDDFDYTSTNIEDFKKALDPYTNTTMGRRYRNIMFMGDTIFICTNTPITEWFPNADDDSREAIFKRIKYIFDFKKIEYDGDCEGLDLFTYEELTKKETLAGKTYYTVNKAVLTDITKPVLDSRGNFKANQRVAELRPVKDYAIIFDLEKYFDVTDADESDEEFLKRLENM